MPCPPPQPTSSRLSRAADGRSASPRDIPEGWYVNLGIGIPTVVADHVPLEREVIFHSENGVLGMGPAPAKDSIEPLADQRRQAVRHAARRRQLLPPRRQLRDDPRRASGSLRARRLPGRRERRHRQLGDQRERHRAGGRRRDGPRGRRQAALGADGAHHQGRHAASWCTQCTYPLTAVGARQAGLHQPRGDRRDRARVRGASTWRRA